MRTQVVEPGGGMAERGPMPPHRTEEAVRDHKALHRRLGRVPDGPAAGEEGEHDQGDDQQGRRGGSGEAHPGGHAVPLPGELAYYTVIAHGAVCGGIYFFSYVILFYIHFHPGKVSGNGGWVSFSG